MSDSSHNSSRSMDCAFEDLPSSRIHWYYLLLYSVVYTVHTLVGIALHAFTKVYERDEEQTDEMRHSYFLMQPAKLQPMHLLVYFLPLPRFETR